MPSFSSPAAVCRPALPSDRADVLEFTKFIWGGNDYIRYVWDEWLADPRGVLVVAEYAGHAVALGKATFVTDGQWWLEGLRVDPKYQGLKIGSHIFQYLDDWWKQHAGGTYRLMTSYERVQVHHLCQRFGWSKIGEVKMYEGAASRAKRAQRAQPAHMFQPVAEAEAPDAARFASANLGYCWGLADIGWKHARPDQRIMEGYSREGTLHWWGEHEGLIAYWDDTEGGPQAMGVVLAACKLEALALLLADLRRLAAELGFASVFWHAPARDDVEAALARAGYESKFPGSAWLFGKEA